MPTLYVRIWCRVCIVMQQKFSKRIRLSLLPALYVLTHGNLCAGHNLKRAFQKSFLLHAFIYFALFIFSAHLFLGANNMRESLQPPVPQCKLHAAPCVTNGICATTSQPLGWHMLQRLMWPAWPLISAYPV